MLPDGWRRCTLEDIAKVSSGGTPDRSRSDYWGGNIPWVTTGEIGNGPINSTAEKITDIGLRNSAAKIFPAGTLLMAMYGQGKTRGRIAALSIDASTNQACAAIIAAKNSSADFLVHNLRARYEEIRNLSHDGSQKNLSAGLIKSLPILLPPLPEQRKIAEILSTWDAAISAQERLIANAKRQKKALMQTLLPTGAPPLKRRLPGFEGEWRSVCLGDIGKLRKGKGIQRDQVRAMGFPCIRYGEIYTQHHEQVRQFHSFIDAETAAESEPISAGDILFTCSGETAEEIGKCVAYLGSEKAFAGGDIIILSPTADNAAFLGYVLNDTDVAEQKRRFGQGNSVVHISAANLSKLTFRLPSRAEQDGIASVLDDATIHIDGLAVELGVLRQEKSALMQQLLTGKRRVRVEEAA